MRLSTRCWRPSSEGEGQPDIGGSRGQGTLTTTGSPGVEILKERNLQIYEATTTKHEMAANRPITA